MNFSKTTCALAAFAAALALCSCEKGDAGKKPAAPPPVSVVKAEEKIVPLVFETYGLVEPWKQISVRSKLTGKITKLGFEPGQKVAQGGLLVQIDSRPYEADLKMYQAQLQKNEFLSADAMRLLALKEKLEKSGSVTQSEMFTQKATAESLRAALEMDRAAIENTKLNIEYCHITAPFDGVAGDILIHQDSIVKANDDIIGKFVQLKPIYVAFALPERLLPAVKAIQDSGKKLEIRVSFPSDKSRAQISGELSFIDNLVDVNSGTIKMKASFANDDEKLWPGQYVNVAVELSTSESFVAVPTDAIMSGQNGQQVFVLKDDATVELRPVKPTRTFAGTTAVDGLKAGETIVSAGQFRLAPGVKVSVKSASPEK